MIELIDEKLSHLSCIITDPCCCLFPSGVVDFKRDGSKAATPRCNNLSRSNDCINNSKKMNCNEKT